MKDWKVVIAGEGGQGVQALAETLSLAAYKSGRKALYIPNFGIEQRGGVSLAMVQVSSREIAAPKFLKADLVAALSYRAVERSRQYFSRDTLLLYDNSLVGKPEVADEVVGLQSYDTIAPEAFTEGREYHKPAEKTAESSQAHKIIALPAADLARSQLHPRVFNMIILGAIIAVTGAVSIEEVEKALEEKLNRRFAQDPMLKEHNFSALRLGYDSVTEIKDMQHA